MLKLWVKSVFLFQMCPDGVEFIVRLSSRSLLIKATFIFSLHSILQVVCVSSFSQTLRRYTSLNHLAQAARAVLQNPAQINQMLSDLNRVDFTNVQVSWPNSLCRLLHVLL